MRPWGRVWFRGLVKSVGARGMGSSALCHTNTFGLAYCPLTLPSHYRMCFATLHCTATSRLKMLYTTYSSALSPQRHTHPHAHTPTQVKSDSMALFLRSPGDPIPEDITGGGGAGGGGGGGGQQDDRPLSFFGVQVRARGHA